MDSGKINKKENRYDWGEMPTLGRLPNPDTYTEEQKLDGLIKGAALIVAEIDKLLRKRGEYADNKPE